VRSAFWFIMVIVMKKLILLIVVAISIILSAYSQIPDVVRQNCYGGSNQDNGMDIVESETGYFIFGYTYSNDGDISNHWNTAYHDWWVVSVDTLGNILWERNYGGTFTEKANQILRKSQDEYYLYGRTGSNDHDVQSYHYGNYDYWIVKIDGLGEIIWEKCFGGSSKENGGKAKLAKDGDILVIANTFSSDGDLSVHYGSTDIWFFKVNDEGDIVWDVVLGNIYGNDEGDVIETEDGGYLITGSTDISEGMSQCDFHGVADVWVVKLDSLRNIEWQNCYGGSDVDFATSGLIELNDGYLLTSFTTSNDGDITGYHGIPGDINSGDIWIVKIDKNGNLLWQKCFGGSGFENAWSIEKTENNGFLILGSTNSYNGDVNTIHCQQSPYCNSDVWIVKIDSVGTIEWEQCYGGNGEEVASNALIKGEYNFVIPTRSDLSNTGDVQCSHHGNDDYWVFEIDLEDTTGIFETPTSQDKIKGYPNPARDYVMFTLPNIQGLTSSQILNQVITIFDFHGRKINNPVIYYMENKIVWDCREVQNGIYFYRLEIEGQSYGGKIVVQN